MPQPPKISADLVLGQAVALLEEHGHTALSLRVLAAKLGVTPNALYWHYADREALLTAAAGYGLDELRRELQAAVPSDVQTLNDLYPVAKAYLDFAHTRPHLYTLITAPGRESSSSAELWDHVLALLSPFVGQELAPRVGVAVWAYLHGAAGLEALNPFHESKPHEGILLGLRLLLAGFA